MLLEYSLRLNPNTPASTSSIWLAARGGEGQNNGMSNDPSLSVASPCIGVCTIDEDSGFCLGCARSLKEVAAWRRLTDSQKQAVLNALPERKRALLAAGVDMRG